MASSDNEVARDVAISLEAAGFRWALLHGEERLRQGGVSDLDVCCDPLDSSEIDRLLWALNSKGLKPLVATQYDSNGYAVFLTSLNLRRFVQLDLLVDPRGEGSYGLRTSIALDRRQSEADLTRLCSVDSWLYQVVKRIEKGDTGALRSLLSSPPDDLEAISARAEELFSDQARSRLLDFLSGGPMNRTNRVGGRVRRIWGRLRQPPCVWIHFGEDASGLADNAVEALSLFLPLIAVRHIRRASLVRVAIPLSGLIWLRPGAIISTGYRPLFATACVEAPSGFERAIELVSDRAARQLRAMLRRAR